MNLVLPEIPCLWNLYLSSNLHDLAFFCSLFKLAYLRKLVYSGLFCFFFPMTSSTNSRHPNEKFSLTGKLRLSFSMNSSDSTSIRFAESRPDNREPCRPPFSLLVIREYPYLVFVFAVRFLLMWFNILHILPRIPFSHITCVMQHVGYICRYASIAAFVWFMLNR